MNSDPRSTTHQSRVPSPTSQVPRPDSRNTSPESRVPRPEFETVIGLEIHAQLSTETKMFCGCALEFAATPNTHTCPVCLAQPGSLPVANKKVIEYAIRIGIALNCDIAEFSQFHRKNYFYPDLPKAYQISQYDLPIAVGGYLEIESADSGQGSADRGQQSAVSSQRSAVSSQQSAVSEEVRRIGITRVHLEEDAAKLTHVGISGRISGADYSLVDFNRGGTPLVEVVTEPDIRSPEEARTFMQKLRSILQHLGVSDCDMEKGHLRCDANISVRPMGKRELGTKTELKNLNSFKALVRGLKAEVDRQIAAIVAGERIVQETRHYDPVSDKTISLRTKEEAHDYRYFPDPDLVPVQPEPAWVEEIRRTLPELPDQRRKRFMDDFNLSDYDARFLTSSKSVGDYFEKLVSLFNDAKTVNNWMQGELSFHLNSRGLEIDQSPISPQSLAELLSLVADGTISGKMAKSVFEEAFESGKKPSDIVTEKGLKQITDQSMIEEVVDKVLEANEETVRSYLEGKEKAFGFLVGQVMRETKGKANPKMVNEMLKEKLRK